MAHGPADRIIETIEEKPLLVALITFPTLLVIASPLGFIAGVFSVILTSNAYGGYGPMVPVIVAVVVLFALLGTYTAYSSSKRVAARRAGQ